MTDAMKTAARALAKAQSIFVLTGAGVSAESGIPTFRGAEGLWKTFRAEELATPSAFQRDPRLVWEWYAYRQGIVAGCEPNAGHHALVRMEQAWPEFLLVTQNVDGLHSRAGSARPIELHGNIWHARCARETSPGCQAARTAHPEREVFDGEWLTVVDYHRAASVPPPCTCGGILRPHIVWFGEQLNGHLLNEAFDRAATAQVLLSIGTSAQVSPANVLPQIAARTGATVIEINPNETANSSTASIALRGGSAIILPQLLEEALKPGDTR